MFERAHKLPIDAASPRSAAGMVSAVRPRPADVTRVLRRALGCWARDNAPLMAAGLAFYVMLALSPLLVVLLAVASPFLASSTVQERLVASAAQAAGPSASSLLQEGIDAVRTAHAGWLASAIGIAASLLAASNVIVQMRYALNVVWGVPRGVTTVRSFVLGRFRLLVVLLTLAVVMLIWVTLDTSVTVLGTIVQHWFPNAHGLVNVVTFGASVLLNGAAFALLYRIVPEAGVQWRDVGLGSIVAALLFTVGKVLLALYFEFSGTFRVYGTAASLAAVLLWLYVSGLVFLLGGEVCAQWSRLRGSRLGVPLIKGTGL